MNRKLENLETFLKYWAKEGWITNNQYYPIFDYEKVRNAEQKGKALRFYH
jgi:hypothetical protein